MQKKHHPLFLVVLLCGALLFLGSTAQAQQGGQDNWQWAGRSLAVPSPAVSRKCITISDAAIYVGTLNASSKCTAIEQYTLAGAYTKTWTTAFIDIGGLAVDNLGNVHAFDQGAAAVKVFDSAGTLLRTWGTAGVADGQFSATSGYMVHAIAVDELKNVYVADWGNRRIQVFDSAGIFKLKFGQQGDLPGQFQNGPAAAAYSPDGFVLAYDTPSNWYHVSQFTPGGTFVKRTVQNTNSSAYVDSFYSRADYGYGGDKAFAVSRDGLLLIGAETTTGFGATAGASRVFQANSIALSASIVVFSSFVTTRGAAFDGSGNVWAVRDKVVECLERRMRFDVYSPVKTPPQPLVLKVSQQPGASVVDIDYQVTAPGTATVETALVAFMGGVRTWDKLVVPKTFTVPTAGVLGAGVPTGTKLRVSWDAAPDMPGQNFATMAFEMLAKDDRDIVGVHYVTLPPDAGNPTALKISNKPVQDADLWDLFLWLLAKGDPRLSVSTTKVMLTAAGQTFIAGAPALLSGTSVVNTVHNGSLITTQGRQFAYLLLNCRPITAAEKTRAAAGNFNLNSVTDNSVISLAP